MASGELISLSQALDNLHIMEHGLAGKVKAEIERRLASRPDLIGQTKWRSTLYKSPEDVMKIAKEAHLFCLQQTANPSTKQSPILTTTQQNDSPETITIGKVTLYSESYLTKNHNLSTATLKSSRHQPFVIEKGIVYYTRSQIELIKRDSNPQAEKRYNPEPILGG